MNTRSVRILYAVHLLGGEKSGANVRLSPVLQSHTKIEKSYENIQRKFKT